MADLPASVLLPVPVVGRTFTASRPIRLADVDPSGGLRLDAIARFLQDVAVDDATGAGLDNALGWVVRRTMIDVDRAAQLGERIDLTTFCSGYGRSWAERRTSITGDLGAAIEAVSLWVQIDPTSGRPVGLGPGFQTIYGDAAGDRRVGARLTLPGLTPGADAVAWSFRRADFDPFHHVNNAAHWVVVEELLQGRAARRSGRAEIEFLTPIDPGVELTLQSKPAAEAPDGFMAWLVAGSKVLTAARWSPRA